MLTKKFLTKKFLFERASQRPFLVWRLITFVILVAMGSSFLLSSYFMYIHIYSTLDLANAITVLNSNMNVTVIDTPGYQQSEDKIHIKETLQIPPQNIRNIFNYTTTTSPPRSEPL